MTLPSYSKASMKIHGAVRSDGSQRQNSDLRHLIRPRITNPCQKIEKAREEENQETK